MNTGTCVIMKIIKRLFKLFKLKFAHTFNDVDDNLFKEILGHTSVKLADKLINTTSKEENQMLINDIEKNKDKIFEQDEYGKFLIQLSVVIYFILLKLFQNLMKQFN